MTQLAMRKSSTTARRHRWAVWVDGRKPSIVASRAKAKSLCARAKTTSYFCRWRAESIPPECRATIRISDFMVWRHGSNGRFARHMHLLPNDMLNGQTVWPFGFSLDTADRERYKRALVDPGIWKLGPEYLLKSFGQYPDRLIEVTWDSDDGMLCAGYRCVGAVSTMAALHAAVEQLDSKLTYCCTVDGDRLTIWANISED